VTLEKVEFMHGDFIRMPWSVASRVELVYMYDWKYGPLWDSGALVHLLVSMPRLKGFVSCYPMKRVLRAFARADLSKAGVKLVYQPTGRGTKTTRGLNGGSGFTARLWGIKVESYQYPAPPTGPWPAESGVEFGPGDGPTHW